jgi:hypothetical protein
MTTAAATAATKYIHMLIADEWTLEEIGEMLHKTIPLELKTQYPDITQLDILKAYDQILIEYHTHKYLDNLCPEDSQ